MTIELLTILQTIGVFCAYSLITIALPAFIFGKKLENRRWTERLVFYFLFGNFYIINLVFLLQTIHLSYRITLFLGTVLPFVVGLVKIKKAPLAEKLWYFAVRFRRIVQGQMGRRNAWLHFRSFVWRGISNVGRKAVKGFFRYFFEWILIALIVLVIIRVYGPQLVTNYGYTVSDQPVHNYWINYLSENEMFVAGVYPFGFHCMIYYLHMMFGVDTYILLHIFGMIQNFYIFMMLAAFIKLVCKSRYLGYATTIFVIIFGGFSYGSYYRFASTLPQEFGMLFILPGIYFLLQFFPERKREIDEKGSPYWSRYCLFAFGMSFSLTLAVHFYDTMIAGLFCVAVAVGYIFRIFRKKYFWNILVAGLLSLFVAVLPMGIAVATGTPLQGSLGWGLNVMNGTDQSGEEMELEGEMEPGGEIETEEEIEPGNTENFGGIVGGNESIGGTLGTEFYEGSTEFVQVESQKSLSDRLAEVIDTVSDKCFTKEYQELGNYLIIGIVLLFVMGIVFWIIRQEFYGSVLVSTAVYMVLMTILEVSGILGLPRLMDSQRASIYYVYSLVIVPALLLDALCFLIRLLIRRERSLQIVSLLCAGGILLGTWMEGSLKVPVYLNSLETKSAIMCLMNIIRQEEDYTWTIVSANDERNMAYDHGYHMELITFLRNMEYYNVNYRMTIPSSTIYFFVEKIPVTYEEASRSGMPVCEEDAKNPLNYQSGNWAYKGDTRWVTMARFYFWAQEFQKMYPNEMKVYYETDEFICYKLTQNPYAQYNLAIDYGYNNVDWNAYQEEQNAPGTEEFE